MDFISNNNKAMIWGLLQDSNIFEGIENEKYNLIQKTFEDTISEIHKNNNGVPLLEKNKMAMNELIININKNKNKNKNKITSRNENPLEMIYTATDLQNHRTNELTIKLKEQQDSMNLLMNPEKPQDVNFSDTSLGDDKPIGDEMDRLIAERMSSRERELELPPVTKEAEKWLNTNANNNNNNNSIPLDKPIDDRVSLSSSTTQSQLIDNKKVSFHENILDNNRQTIENKQNTTTSIFSKLKRKQNITSTDSVLQSTNDMNIEYTLKIIKENQEQLKNTCNQILELLQHKKIA